MAFKLKEYIATEHQEHMSLMQWVRMRKDIEPYLIHIPNGGRMTLVQGRILRLKGVKSGVSDIFLAKPCGNKAGLWLELKKRKFSIISTKQKEWIDLMITVGYEAQVAYGWEHAKEIIENYLSGSNPNDNECPL